MARYQNIPVLTRGKEISSLTLDMRRQGSLTACAGLDTFNHVGRAMRDFTSGVPGEVATAMSVLRTWLEDANAKNSTDNSCLSAASDYPCLSREYDRSFSVDREYIASLPDMQNADISTIPGAKRRIQHVGIADFKLPLKYKTRDGVSQFLETSVVGTVSLDESKRGINMSRIMRTFYDNAGEPVSFESLENILCKYLAELESDDARLELRFEFPTLNTSLRSRLHGFQYYTTAIEVALTEGKVNRYLHLEYVYSSTCPCSLELSEHARQMRNQLATPHSQRSKALVSVKLSEEVENYPVEELITHCRRAIPTETQVIVKREDEQAFAELNAANAMFVEDAVRRIARELDRDRNITDYKLRAQHEESLHSHDAVSILLKGEAFSGESLSTREFGAR